MGAFDSAPAQEFAAHRFDSTRRKRAIRGRILSRAVRTVFDPASVTLLGATTIAIASIGACEATLLLAGDSSSSDAIVFAAAYAGANLLPSCVWSTVDGATVAHAVGLDAHALLAARGGCSLAVHTLQQAGIAVDMRAEQLAAVDQLGRAWLGAGRAIAAGFMLLAQVLRAVAAVAKAPDNYARAVLDGTEPPLEGIPERFVRLCGVGSEVTALSLAAERCGEHIIPVFEEGAGVWLPQPPGAAPGLGPLFTDVAAAEPAGTAAARNRPQPAPPAYHRAGTRLEAGAAQRARHRMVRAAHESWPAGRRAAGSGEGSAAGSGWLQWPRPHSVGVPVYWLVGAEDYGEVGAWEGLAPALRPSSLIRSSTGRRLLVVEADTTVPGRALAPSGQGSDLSFDDAALAFGRVSAVARSQPGSHHLRTMRVLLGDSQRRLGTGGGSSISVRQRFDFAGEADVLVDSRAPILLRLRAWMGGVRQRLRLESGRGKRGKGDPSPRRRGTAAALASAPPVLPGAAGEAEPPMPAAAVTSIGAKPERPALVLDTGSPEYFAALAPLVEAAGFRAVDVTAVLSRKQARRTPRLVYHASTARTIAIATAMVQADALDPALACLVIDTDSGRGDLTAALQEARGDAERGAPSQPPRAPPLEVICAARIWDDLLRSVRMWAREGHTAEAIQAELDRRFKPVLSAA